LREVVLLQKIHSNGFLREFENFLRGFCSGLKVELIGLSVVENGWIKIKISGEDEGTTVRFLEREIGLAPITLECVQSYSVLYGRIILSRQSKKEISVDVGVFSPKPVYATVSLQRLQGQLVDGKKISLKQIVDLFGVAEGLSFEVRIVKIGTDELKAELTERQLGLYSSWIDARTDRLVILGAVRERVKRAVQMARLDRDVLEVESLDILEHAAVCKLGTDAKGLIPRLGKWLLEARFTCFSPRRILDIVGERW